MPCQIDSKGRAAGLGRESIWMKGKEKEDVST
jgi:hypothetical protein